MFKKKSKKTKKAYALSSERKMCVYNEIYKVNKTFQILLIELFCLIVIY